MRPDVETTFDKSRFRNLKVTENGKIVGFAALRDSDYITHLFIDIDRHGNGLGKQLLNQLLILASSNEVRLRASVNAVKFYESQGFIATDSENEVNGVRFVPMRRVRT